MFEDDTDVHMVMELCEGASLTDAVTAGRLVQEQDIAMIMCRWVAGCGSCTTSCSAGCCCVVLLACVGGLTLPARACTFDGFLR